jgi:benzoyl-CoA reductase subunit C
MFTAFHEAIADIPGTIRKQYDRLGRPVIGVMPAYFPLELIHAAGGYPLQLWGAGLAIERADAYLQSYCCSVARSVLELEMRGVTEMVKAYVFTSLCDTLVNLREIYRRLFTKPTLEFSIPATQTPQARRAYLADVLQKTLKGLEGVTGCSISKQALQAAAALYGRVRSLQRQLYHLRRQRPGVMKNLDFYAAIKSGFFLPVEEYGRLLEILIETVEKGAPAGGRRPRLVLSGMVFDPLAGQALLDELGVDVVDDDFASGWRSASRQTLKVDDLVDGVADYVFSGAPCCCIHNPANDRHPYLVEKIKAAAADGILFWYVKFCEPDAFDRPQLLERFKQEGIPAATVELDLSAAGLEPVRTRIQAFCEMIEGWGA